MSSESFSKESDRTKVKRIALSLQYDGLPFCGWQRQCKGLSVQSVLEDATPSFIFNEKFNIQELEIVKKRVPTIVIVSGYNMLK